MGSVTLKAIVGFVAGLLAWAVIEPTRPAMVGMEVSPDWPAFEVRMISMVGLLVGLAIGGLSGWARGSQRHVWIGLLLGGLLGFIGIRVGYGLGGSLAEPLTAMRAGPLAILWRVIAIAPAGLGLGLGIGGSGLTLRRFVQGGIGGLIGGAVAGALFDPIAEILSPALLIAEGVGAGARGDTGGPSRAATFAIMGLMVALFVALVERVSRTAWVRLVLGKNEGREWALDAPVTTIGRDERVAIPLWGDNDVVPLHATITHQGPHWILTDGGSPMGTVLNGQRIGQAGLMPGATFQIGRHTLQFLTKAVPRGAVVAPAPMATPVAVPVPTLVAPPKEGALVVLDGPATGNRVTIRPDGEAILGREGGALPMPFDPGVSRRHARLSLAPGGLLLEDLGSTNGTFVNGARTDRTFLRPGDVVKVGATSLRVEKSE